jgi:RNA polymerase sigma-70 factor (ECF subfamily)
MTAGQTEPARLLAAAAAGDGEAFRRLTDPHRRELTVHCYRMLGSLDDADDAVQDSMIKAWQGLAGFAGRSSLRAWLYRIATNVCLDTLDHRARRVLPTAIVAAADPAAPPAPDDHDTPWLQPYPDARLDPVDPGTDPATVMAQREHVELAFVAAIQHLPARQRAVLLLRDVLGYSAAETAELIGSTSAAVHSGLQRARATVEAGLPAVARHRPDRDLAELVRRYVRAWHAADIPALIALLRDDAHMAMPPTPSWYLGRDAIAVYLRQLFSSAFGRQLRLRPTAANHQPALAVYAPTTPTDGDLMPFAVKVLTVCGDRISAITGFVTPHLFPAFALPDRLPGGAGPESGREFTSVSFVDLSGRPTHGHRDEAV